MSAPVRVSKESAPWLVDVRGEGPPPPLDVVLTERLAEIRDVLGRHGVVLVRGARPASRADATLRHTVVTITDRQPRPYSEQSSPRTQVSADVFTATDFPRHAEIFLHNELSYAASWPTHLAFYCAHPAERGGETLLADCRRVYEDVPADIRAAFAERSWMYVRNLRGSAGLDWRTVFQTTSRSRVTEYCQANGIRLEWMTDGVRVSAVRDATLDLDNASGPGADGVCWFNHIAAFHISTLPPDLSRSLLRLFTTDRLPVNTYFGTGEPIPDEMVAEIRAAYRRATVALMWQAGDLAVVDNVRVAHGRLPYEGRRELFVLLAGEASR